MSGNRLLQGLFLDMFHGRKPGNRFLKVESGEQALAAGRLFQVAYEFSYTGSAQRILRLVAPVDFKINFAEVGCDAGSCYYRAFRADTLEVTGTFDTDVPVFSAAGVVGVADYTRQFTLQTHSGAATLTPNSDVPAAVQRIRVASQSNRATSVPATQGSARALPAGTYYIVFENLDGVTGDSTGTYTLRVEELPQGFLTGD